MKIGTGDKVRWGADVGTVINIGTNTYDVQFESGSVFSFQLKTNKLDDGKLGTGDALVLVAKAAAKKTVKLYRWEKIGTSSTGRTFLKQTEGLYDEEHAAKVLTGYSKIEGSERIVEVS